MTFKKLRKYIVASHNKGCVILNVRYRLCFTKVCGMWDIFDKNSFTLGMIQFPWEYLFFFVGSMLRASYKKSLQKQFSFGSDSRKAVNRRVPDISSYCSISNSTACSTPWIFFIVPKNKHLYFHRTHLVLCCIASNVYPKRILLNFILILGEFCEAKIIRGTSLISSTVIWSYVTLFLNWRQKEEWNSLGGSRAWYIFAKAIAIRHNEQRENNAFNTTWICD